MKNEFIIICLILFVFQTTTQAQLTYSDNQYEANEDMLTPGYYLSAQDAPFRDDVNQVIFYARSIPFQHPLEDSAGNKPEYLTPRFGVFGAGKGVSGTSQHHPAIDFRIGDMETEVTLYAAHEGYINTYRDAPKYRHYLSIRKDITDSTGNLTGKMLTIYAHIDLDLDSADNLLLEGKFVNKGDVVSRNLYSGTVGGAHLHFEIRYYRPGDIGDEDFYGSVFPGIPTAFTQPSAGSWSYGFWNPDTGYGYANPVNHFPEYTSEIVWNSLQHDVSIYPNPVQEFAIIELPESFNTVEPELSIYNSKGQLMDQFIKEPGPSIHLNLSEYNSGLYFIHIIEGNRNEQTFLKLIKK